jgi:AcrR family transcriptional regulator
MANDAMREQIITATLELAAERSILAVSMSEIANRAGLSLAELRARAPSRISILEDFAALIDEKMLAGGAAEAEEPPRERLLDVMMRRFDALAPYRPGLKGLRKAAMRDPIFAATLNHIAVGAQKWTLAAARLEPTGPFAPARRLARAEALVLVVASVLPTFLDDTEEGLPRTMAALDSALLRLDRVAQVVTRMERFVDRVCSAGPKWKRRGKGNGAGGEGSPKGDGPGPGGMGPSGDGTGSEDASPFPTGVFVRSDLEAGPGFAVGPEPDETARRVGTDLAGTSEGFGRS